MDREFILAAKNTVQTEGAPQAFVLKIKNC